MKILIGLVLLISTSSFADKPVLNTGVGDITPSCEMSLTMNNVGSYAKNRIRKILKQKGYIDMDRPGCIHSNNGTHCDFGKRGHLWVYASIVYDGGFLPDHLSLKVTHSVYSENNDWSKNPIENWHYHHQEESASWFGNDLAIINMMEKLPNCNNLKIKEIEFFPENNITL